MPRSTKSPAEIPPPSLASRGPASTRVLVSGVLGCDVGKASIVVFDSRDGRTSTLANRREALDALMAGLDADCLVVCEATGGYEDALLEAALAAGIPAHRADARKVKAFIRSSKVSLRACSARPTHSTPRRLPPTAGSAMPGLPAGRPPTPPASGCRRSC